MPNPLARLRALAWPCAAHACGPLEPHAQADCGRIPCRRSRRKFRLNRPYPRNMECDDSKTTARLEHGALIVEMPILKLPSVPPAGKAAAAADPPAAKASKKGKAAAGATEATRAPDQQAGGRRPGGGVHGGATAPAAASDAAAAPKKKRSEAGAGASDGAATAAEAPPPKRLKKGGSGAAASSSGGDDRMQALLNEAVEEADARQVAPSPVVPHGTAA
jgi:hypothetical protein